MNRKNHRKDGIVYSTNPDFSFEESNPEAETLLPHLQQLRVILDTKQRAGKTVTLVEGFTGRQSDLDVLGKMLKTKCGTGGSVKEGVILVQGNYREKIKQLLAAEGYRVRG